MSFAVLTKDTPKANKSAKNEKKLESRMHIREEELAAAFESRNPSHEELVCGS